MRYRGAEAIEMTEPNNEFTIATERYERRLAEECGKLRVETGGVRLEISAVRLEMAQGFGETRAAIGSLRAEMIDRQSEMLRWFLIFGVTVIAAVGGLFALFL